MKKTILALVFLGSLSACDKNRNNQYSTWVVNGEGFSTRDVHYETSKGGTYLSSTSNIDGFSLGWKMQSPPSPGYLFISIDTVSHNPGLFRLSISRGGAHYRLSPYNADSVLVSTVNGKNRYEMQPAWYLNNLNPLDSVWVYGTFNNP